MAKRKQHDKEKNQNKIFAHIIEGTVQTNEQLKDNKTINSCDLAYCLAFQCKQRRHINQPEQKKRKPMK